MAATLGSIVIQSLSTVEANDVMLERFGDQAARLVINADRIDCFDTDCIIVDFDPSTMTSFICHADMDTCDDSIITMRFDDAAGAIEAIHGNHSDELKTVEVWYVARN